MSNNFKPCFRCGGKVEEDFLCRIRCTKCGYDFQTMSIDPDFEPKEDACEYCKDVDTLYDLVCYIPTKNGFSIDVPVNYCPVCGRNLWRKNNG